jgi:uroporphyrinogen-III decarboxylase
LHQCKDRQKKLLDVLTEKRSERLTSQVNENASILNLVQMWRDEEGRKELLKIAQLEQQSIVDEVERISSVSEIKLKILGLSKNQILNS